MLTVDEAIGRIVDDAPHTPPEEVPLAAALGRVLVDPRLVATVDVPPFANSAMDGYAIHAADTPGELRLTGEVAAGAGSLPGVDVGAAVRVMTGAPIPPGADAVVPIEHASEGRGRVRVEEPVVAGAHVRSAGHDTRRGDEVCLPGELTAAQIAVIASLGLATVSVYARPRVAVLSTGDELVDPGASLGPGQIHDANSVALGAAVREAGAEPVTLERAPDDLDAIEARLREAAERADVVVVSGGVSVGRHDHVRSAIERLGSLEFWRIAVQPGKPLAFGRIGDVPVVGLPGNPVSALVTFELFVRPLLRAMHGLTGDGRARVSARPTRPIDKDPRRRAFLRVVVRAAGDGYAADPAGGQGSSQLRPLAEANALLDVPAGEPRADPAATYEARLTGPIR
jgi:molybdopterin molybdotransferase